MQTKRAVREETETEKRGDIETKQLDNMLFTLYYPILPKDYNIKDKSSEINPAHELYALCNCREEKIIQSTISLLYSALPKSSATTLLFFFSVQ